MDRTGADFLAVCVQIKEHIGATALPVVPPIGAEEKFEGLVDLIYNNAIYCFDDKTVRDNFELREIPDSMKAEVAEWRATPPSRSSDSPARGARESGIGTIRSTRHRPRTPDDMPANGQAQSLPE